MANICDTDYIFSGEPEQVARLASLFEKCHAKSQALEDVLIEAGVQGIEELPRRCSIYSVDHDPESNRLEVCTEWAWSEKNSTIDKLLELYPGVHYLFASEEPGCDYYVTNDAFGSEFDPYMVEYNDEENSYARERLVLDAIEEILGMEIDSLRSIEDAREAISKHNREHEDDLLYLREFTIVD